jgi:NAD(P)-dependent dehydrogenase (short-subunit alcohol dehydrogenase family)
MGGSLDGRVALVTGGGSGVGRVSAEAFARAGARVMLADRDRTKGEAAAAALTAAGFEARFVEVDVADPADADAMVAAVVAAFGRLDCALNNAGVLGAAFVPILDYPLEAWDQVIRINLTGVWLSMKSEIRQMLRQGGGAIVNMSSVAGLIGTRMGTAYAASKHGVVGLTKAAALEYAANGIRVNAICPSWIDTPLTEPVAAAQPEMRERLIQRQPTGRLCTAEEVAEAALWLCSDGASFVTGHALPVDGGVVVQ